MEYDALTITATQSQRQRARNLGCGNRDSTLLLIPAPSALPSWRLPYRGAIFFHPDFTVGSGF